MKILFLVCCFLIAHFGSASWLADVFTGFNEGLDETFDNKQTQELGEKVNNVLKKASAVINKVEPLANKFTEQVKTQWKDASKTPWHHEFKKIMKNAVHKLKKLKKDKQLKKMSDTLKKNIKEPSFIKKTFKDIAKKVIKATKVMEPLKPVVEGEKLMEKWISKYFVKPHSESNAKMAKEFSSAVEKIQSEQMNKKNTMNNDGDEPVLFDHGVKTPLEQLLVGTDRPIPDVPETTPKKIVFEKADDKYFEAEKKWEKELTQETTKLLKKLDPATAFAIPDISGLNKDDDDTVFSTLLPTKGKKKHKQMMTGNENWKLYDQYRHRIQTKDDPFEDYMEKPKHMGKTKAKHAGKTKSKHAGKTPKSKILKDRSGWQWVKEQISNNDFKKMLAKEEGRWMDEKTSIVNKLHILEKKKY